MSAWIQRTRASNRVQPGGRGPQGDLREVQHGHVAEPARTQRAGERRGAPAHIHHGLLRPDPRQTDHLQGHPRRSLVPAHTGRAALLEHPIPVAAPIGAGGHRRVGARTGSPVAAHASNPPIMSVAARMPISWSVAAARLD